MAYQVMARRWRPRNFHQLIGQTHISQTLMNALKNNRLAHALLFSGPRGTGKTSSARIVAQSLRCVETKEFGPCGKCAECEQITLGSSVDVIEIDGASNNGVDSVRELRQSVGYMPSSGSFKVYIIDEVHMLSGAAFNALLKTLEEPPSHVIFIMATTEPHKLPQTVLSRCQRFDFHRIPTELVKESLAKICKQESISADEEVLWLIARKSEGSMRDAQSLLDQAVCSCEDKLTLSQVIPVLGLVDRELLFFTLESLVFQNTNNMIQITEKIFKSGYDPLLFIQDLLEEIRNLLIIKIGGKISEKNKSNLLEKSQEEVKLFEKLSQKANTNQIYFLFDKMLQGVQSLSYAQDPRIVLEILLLQMAEGVRTQEKNESVLAQKDKNVLSDKKEILSNSNIRQSIDFYENKDVLQESKAVSLETGNSKPDKDPLSNSKGKWTVLVNRIKKVNPSLGAKLENVYCSQIKDGRIQIGISKKQGFLFDELNQKEVQKKICNYIHTFWGSSYTMDMNWIHEKDLQKDKSLLTLEQQAQIKKKRQQHKLEEQVAQDHLVKSVKELFSAQVTKIKEL